MCLNQGNILTEPCIDSHSAFVLPHEVSSHDITQAADTPFPRAVQRTTCTATKPSHMSFTDALPHSRYRDDALPQSRYRDSLNSDVIVQQGRDLIASLAAQSSLYTPALHPPQTPADDTEEPQHVLDCPMHPANQRSVAPSSPALASSPATDDTTDVDQYVNEYRRKHGVNSEFDNNYDVGAPAVYIKEKAVAGEYSMSIFLHVTPKAPFSPSVR